MLIVATAVFVYYTVWTLLMVSQFPALSHVHILISGAALRRRWPPTALALPTPRMGHPHPCYPHPHGHRSRRIFPVFRHDSKQQEEGIEGEAGAEGEVIQISCFHP